MTTIRRLTAITIVTILAGLVHFAMVPEAASASDISRPRVIVTTDGEADDQCSMVRYLLYADQFRTRGLIYSSSKHHWAGNDDVAPKKWHGTRWIQEQLDAYATVFPVLRTHADFPEPADLRSQVATGNIASEGDMDAETAGSQRIVHELLKPDTDPVWLLAWGGPNTIARALKSIAEQHPESVEAVSQRTRLYLISEQDHTYRDYVAPNWPGINTLVCNASTYGALAYRWEAALPRELHRYFTAAWIQENLVNGHGLLAALYRPRKDGAFRSEGDSPSFMHLIHTGLRRGENHDWSGWGGRFERRGNAWRSAKDPGPHTSPLIPWIRAMQNEFAARADWCVRPVTAANHAPAPVVDGALDRRAAVGDRVSLRAHAEAERPGESLSFRWWQDTQSGCSRPVAIMNADSATDAYFVVPDFAGETIHVVLQVSDDGVPPLSRWQRVVVHIDPP